MINPTSAFLCALLLAGCSQTPAANPAQPQSTSGSQAIASISQPELNGALMAGSGGGGRRSRRRARAAENSQPGAFDFYLLNLSWSPEFCATHPGSQECATHPGFVVHGLWPQNNDGTYPEKCSTAAGPADPQRYLNLIPTVSLINHEWATHGTCSGLAADAYFSEVGTAFHKVRIPPAIAKVTQSATLKPGEILSEFAAANPGFPQGSFALSCGNNYLTAVEVCLSKALEPEACQNIHSCGATVVKITPQ